MTGENLKRATMFDIKAIRENPDEFDALWAKRGLAPQSKAIIDKDKLIRKAGKLIRKAGQVVQEAEAARNKASKQIGQAMAQGDKDRAEELKAEVAGAKNVIAAMGRWTARRPSYRPCSPLSLMCPLPMCPKAKTKMAI